MQNNMEDNVKEVDERSHPKMKKLPPLSPRPKKSENGEVQRPRKKKRDLTDLAGEQIADGTPRRRRRSGSENRNLGTSLTVTVPDNAESAKRTKKKKLRSPRVPENPDSSNAETPRRKKQRTNIAADGSRASLVDDAEAPSETSPRTTTDRPRKGRKKKARKTRGVVNDALEADEDEYGDSGLAADLTSIGDDVIPANSHGADEEEDGEEDMRDESRYPHSATSATVLKSQPMTKMFIETNRGFKSEDKAKITRKLEERLQHELSDEPEGPSVTTMEFGLKTHHVLQTISLFIHGLTAGISMWQIVIVYVLSYHSDEDLLLHYRPLALPVQCMFYILLVICTVSACDRHDVGRPTRHFVLRAFTLQSGAVSIVIYFLALMLSLISISVEDRINLFTSHPELWQDSQVMASELALWRNLNTARGVFAILGWFVISLTPKSDRLVDNLTKADDKILIGVEMAPVSRA